MWAASINGHSLLRGTALIPFSKLLRQPVLWLRDCTNKCHMRYMNWLLAMAIAMFGQEQH
jgi:hypothetical protein